MGADPNEECHAFSCAGYYYGVINGECYEKQDPWDADVQCLGPMTCESADAVCAAEPSPKPVPVPGRPLCTAVMAGCVGTTGPSYQLVAPSTDPLEDCDGAQICTSEGACAPPP
jgi:hypothetical protein